MSLYLKPRKLYADQDAAHCVLNQIEDLSAESWLLHVPDQSRPRNRTLVDAINSEQGQRGRVGVKVEANQRSLIEG